VTFIYVIGFTFGFFYGIGGVFYQNFDVFLDFFLSSFFINYNEKERKKKILKVHYSSNYDTTSTIKKILRRGIHRQQGKSSTVPEWTTLPAKASESAAILG